MLLSCILAQACGNSNDAGPPTNTGQTCKVPDDCYPALNAGSLDGDPQCLTRVPNGYCTHHCTADADCCAVPGECPLGFPEVCGPFESTGEMDCFLSCEAADLARAGFTDETAFCQKYANAAFICRSSGGGSKNRKVCVPNGRVRVESALAHIVRQSSHGPGHPRSRAGGRPIEARSNPSVGRSGLFVDDCDEAVDDRDEAVECLRTMTEYVVTKQGATADWGTNAEGEVQEMPLSKPDGAGWTLHSVIPGQYNVMAVWERLTETRRAKK